MIKHFIKYNVLNIPIHYYTLEEHELEECKNTQTEEQIKLNEWIASLWQEQDVKNI